MSATLSINVDPIKNAIESFGSRDPKVAISDEFRMTNLLADLLKRLAVLRASVKRTPMSQPVESGDMLVSGMLELQIGLQECLYKLKDTTKTKSLAFRFFAMLWASQFRLCHKLAGEIRTFILEHDADISPPSGRGPFTNADDLIRSLRS